MTSLEALVSISQTALQVRGEWCVQGIDDILRRDISNVVHDCARILRLEGQDFVVITRRAIDELERRACVAD